MAYTIWVDAEGYANADHQIIETTKAGALREVKDLRAMDCGKIVCMEHPTMDEAERFVDYVSEVERPTKVATLLKKFRG